MPRMKELKHMFWMMLGVLIGFAAGLFIFIRINQAWPEIADSHITLLVAIPILGGGLLGGGYLAQWLVYRYERAKRQKKQDEKKKSQVGRKKRKQ